MADTNPVLKQAQNDVPVDSSPAPDDTQTKANESTDSPASGAGKKSGDGADESKTGGRDIDNVRGELTRKLEKGNSDLRNEMAELKGMIAGMTAATPPKTAGSANDISNMTADQLAARAGDIPDAQKAEFDKLVNQKRSDELVDNRFRQNVEQHDFKTRRVESNTEAYGRWPELNDPQGAFYKETNKVLNEMGPLAAQNPYSMRDASNEAGARMGLTPKARSVLRQQHGVTRGNTAPAPGSDPDAGKGISKAEASEIAKNLSGALRKGKFSDEMIDNVVKNSKQYDSNRRLLGKG